MSLPDPTSIAIAFAAFFLGGAVKGLAGIGLPMVALPVLAIGFSVPQAVGLTLLPILVANGWQALASGAFGPVVRRFWPMQLTLGLTLMAASRLLVALSNDILLICAGTALLLSALGSRVQASRALPAGLERPVGVLTGLVAGGMGGVSSLFGVPVIIYLTSLNLSRAEFVTTVSIVYLLAVLPYAAGLFAVGVLQPADLVGSALCVVPAMVGLRITSRRLENLDKARFRALLRALLVLMGLWMVVQGTMASAPA